MMFLSGHKANGKSTICDFLRQEGFFAIDTGPFFRDLANTYQPGLDSAKYIELMTQANSDKDWAVNTLINFIQQIYAREGEKYIDMVIAGYRNYDGLLFIINRLIDNIYPEQDIAIWFVQCTFRNAHMRLRKRESRKVSIQELRSQYHEENKIGLLKIKGMASCIIDNNQDPDHLLIQIRKRLPVKQKSP